MSMMEQKVKLYMRKRCHLCDEARFILEELQQSFSFTIEEVDIDQDDRLTERYGISIPVIEYNGEELQAGIITKTFLYEAFSKRNL